MRRIAGATLVVALAGVGLAPVLASPAASAPVVPARAPAAPAVVRPQHFPTDGDFVDWAFERTLSREPDAPGLAYWVGQLAAGLDPVVFLDVVLHSTEHAEWTAPVLRAYRTAYGRGADLAGLRYWTGLRLGPTFESVLPYFLASPEHDALYGGTSDAEYVRRIYV